MAADLLVSVFSPCRARHPQVAEFGVNDARCERAFTSAPRLLRYFGAAALEPLASGKAPRTADRADLMTPKQNPDT